MSTLQLSLPGATHEAGDTVARSKFRSFKGIFIYLFIIIVIIIIFFDILIAQLFGFEHVIRMWSPHDFFLCEKNIVFVSFLRD